MSATANISECIQEMNVGFDATEKQALRGLKAVAQRILSEAQQSIKKQRITAFGQLINSGSVIVEGDKVDVGFTAKHAPFVEYGRKAGRMPPIQIIKAWARRKLRVSEKEADSVAFSVARKIAREGTKAQPFLMPAYEKAKSMIPEIMKKFVK